MDCPAKPLLDSGRRVAGRLAGHKTTRSGATRRSPNSMTIPLHDLGLPSDVLVWHALLLTALSFSVGVLGGFVGLALGSMRLPVLLLLGLPTTLAAGTNIVISAASAATGSVRHLREGRVDGRLVMTMGVPSIAGGFLGAFYSHRAPAGLLIGLVGLLLVWQGWEFLFRTRVGPQADPVSADGERGRGSNLAAAIRRRPAAAESTAGFGIGVVGGAVGLILGGARLPVLVRLLQVDPRIAAGSSMFVGFLLGTMGFLGHMLRGNVDYPLVVFMGSTAMIGSYLGARYTGRVSRDRLVATMGMVLMTIGVAMVWRAFSA